MLERRSLGRRAAVATAILVMYSPCLLGMTSSSRGAAVARIAPHAGGAARSAAGDVSRDSLRAIVRFLSTDPATGLSRSRFVLRENEIGIVADSLAARLERITGSSAVREPFTITIRYPTSAAPESTFVAENIASRMPGNGSLPGAVVLSAHYDAIGARTPQWGNNWKTWPAPGADDNATGVAAVMECARSLAGRDLPFSVIVVLFSGEELGKLGSAYFVEHYGELFDEPIIAVINADMIGYAAPGEFGASISSNYDSGWLAEMLIDSAEVIEPSLPIRLYRPGISNSDHGSFWDAGIPGLWFIEPLGPAETLNSPYYHTLGDTFGTVDFDQVEGVARVMAGFLAGLADGVAEVALLQPDLLLESRGIVTGRRIFHPGDTVTVVARVRNAGSRSAPQGADIGLRVTIENARGERGLFFEYLDPPAPLEAAVVRVPIVIDDGAAGGNIVRASIGVWGMEDDPGNNAAVEQFAVESTRSLALMHSFEPNPVRGAFSEASFCVDLVREAEPTLELYTIEGTRVGSAGALRWGGTLGAGLTCLRCSQLFPGLGRLASGVYGYRLLLREPGGGQTVVHGKLAVEN